jgi:cytochrome c oxidase subunit 2
MTEYLQKFMPVLSSEMGHLGDELNGYVHILMFLLMAGWGMFFIFCLVRFSKKNNPKANYKGITNHYSKYVEIGIVVFEAVLLIGFDIPGYSTVKYDKLLDRTDNELEIRVVAQQFAWNIHYPGEDGKFGTTRIELVDEEINPLGLDREGYGADDITTINQLHLPVNKQAKLYISSKDVIHSFSLPEMRVKQDAIPGMQIPIYFTPVMTTDEFLKEIVGTEREGMGYEIACAQLCGNSHYRMRGFMTIHTPEDYKEWLLEEAEYLESDGEDDWDDEW